MYHDNFVVNPAAGAGRCMAVWEKLKVALDNKGVDYQAFFSEKKGDITALTYKITAAGDSDIVNKKFKIIIVGGDGTINEAFQGISDYSAVEIGYIPAGSANDFATNTGISKEPLEALEQVLSCKSPTSFDLGSMTYDDEAQSDGLHYFSSSCGIGYDAAVSKAAMSKNPIKNLLDRLGLGSFIFLVMAIKTLITVKRGDMTMTLDDRDVVPIHHFLFVCSMIYRYEGGGFLFSPEAEPDDGKLDICVFGNIPKWKVLIAFPSAYKGTHYKFKDVTAHRAEKVQIRTSQDFYVQLDGEVSKMSSAITLYCTRGGLKLLK